MSINPEYDRTVTLRPYPNGAESEPGGALAVDQALPVTGTELYPPAQPVQPAYLPEPPRFAAPAPVAVTARGRRPRWVAPAAIGAVGLIASGSLGYLLWTASGQRDAARHQLASTQLTLSGTQALLSTVQADAAAQKVTADYVSQYIVDSAKVLTDDKSLNSCGGFGQCRTAAQQELNDMQAFQSDRTKATVPAALANSDAMLGDALSAGIAGLQELISGMDNNNVAKITGGWAKLNKATLSMGKAEAALGAGLK